MELDAPASPKRALGAFSDSENDEHNTRNEVSDDQMADYIRPKGGLAARMHEMTSKPILSDSESDAEKSKEEDEDEELKGLSARERMKILLAREATKEKEKQKNPVKEKRKSLYSGVKRTLKAPVVEDDKSEAEKSKNEAQSEDDDKPVAAPKRRTIRLSSPVASQMRASSRPSSRPSSIYNRSSPGRALNSDEDDDIPVGPRRRTIRLSSPVASQMRASSRPSSVYHRSSPARALSDNGGGSNSPSNAGSKDEEEGMFVRDDDVNQNSKEEGDLPPMHKMASNSRFQALVEKKRKERLAKEVAEREQKERRIASSLAHAEMLAEDDVSGSDDEAGRQMTQKTREPRKASKKAIEEMQRETQRMARQMQLAHRVVTKKKITKSSLFERFNYKPVGYEQETAESSSPRKSDVTADEKEESDTPPTSQASPSLKPMDGEQLAEQPVETAGLENASSDDGLPTMAAVLSSPGVKQRRLDKGKGKAPSSPGLISSSPPVRKIKVVRLKSAPLPIDSDSDDDLEVVKKTPIKGKIDAIFDRVPGKKAELSGGIHALRLLAQVNAPAEISNKKAKQGMNSAELTVSLQLKARQQAAREREEHLQSLRDRGIHVPTAEEREQRQDELQDLVALAREEEAKIREQERLEERRERKARGETDVLDNTDEDEDADWNSDQASSQASDEDADDEIEAEISGSEEEEEDEDEEMVEGALIDSAAEESDNDEDVQVQNSADAAAFDFDEDDIPVVAASSRRKSKKVIVDSSDEDSSAEILIPASISVENTPRPLPAVTPSTRRTYGKSSPTSREPTSVLRSATKSFIPGIPVTGPVGLGMGLTQIFQGTMDSQADYDGSPLPSPSQGPPREQDSMEFLNNLPPPNFGARLGPTPPKMVDEYADEMDVIKSSQMDIDTIPATQEDEASHGIILHYQTQDIEMTQDQGLANLSPIKGRYSATPAPTVDTMVLDSPGPSIIADSPVKRRKGKLRRRGELAVAALSSSDDDAVQPKTADAFDVLRRKSLGEKKGRKEKKTDDFKKKKSAARAMMDEAATESEDEYRGLGGLSGSDIDSNDENEELDHLNEQMIDETLLSRLDADQLARFNAERARLEDETMVNKLYRDVMQGGLRRKRGLNYGLSDSDDDGGARRRMKRREFAKMRKALFEDERVGKIAENPKRAAFLRSIAAKEDGDEGDMDWLDDTVVAAEFATNSQLPEGESQDLDSGVGESQEKGRVMGPPALPTTRLPAAQRRTGQGKEAPFKRPTSLAEIRASISSLTEDPHKMAAAASSESGSDSELDIEPQVGEGLLSDDEEDHSLLDTSIILGERSIVKQKRTTNENTDPFAKRRKTAVVDRSLSRQNSASSTSSNSRLAFAAPSTGGGPKMPSLLRRATGNSAASSFSGEMPAAAKPMRDVAKPAAKRGFKGFSRAEERKAMVEEKEKGRLERKMKGREVRLQETRGLFG